MTEASEGSFPELFSPLQMGNKCFRNRIVSSANFSGLSENNMPSKRFAYYHAEKAKGGVALTVTEELPVSSTTKFALPRSIFAYERSSITGFKMMTEMVHNYGALASAQLIHRGAHQYGFDSQGLEVKRALAPSQIPSLVSPDGYSVPQEMTIGDIESEIRNYVQTASNMLEAEFDGIEIKCDASSLPIQFLSPLTNKREDEFGGSFENRLKMLLLLVQGIYEVTRGKSLLGIKMPGNEFIKGGLTLNDTQRVAKTLADTRKVNYISVGGGNLGFDPDLNTPSAYYPQGLFVNLAEGIKQAVGEKMKVMALGRITEPSYANEVIAQGRADLVIMMRALIADPELPRKARDGKTSEIIPCIGCNQGCLGHVLQNRSTSCILNPVIGREENWGTGTLTKSSTPKRIVIVGAGPGGLECARISTIRGHVVTIVEKESEIGGQARIASKLPGRTDLSRALRFWENELRRLKINLILEKNASTEDIMKMDPEVVVCATGSAPEVGFSPAFSKPWGSRYIREISEIAKLSKGERTGKASVIYDDRGDFQALGWAELSAIYGAQTTLVTRNPMVGLFVDSWTRLTATKRLYKLGIKFVTDSFPSEIREDSLMCFNIYDNSLETAIDSDFTYFLGWNVSRIRLFNELKTKGFSSKAFTIGDSRAPRSIEEAVYEGHHLARTF